MEVAVSIIYSIPYNGINLNWTAVTGNNGILMEFSQEEIRLHGIPGLYRLLLASILG